MRSISEAFCKNFLFFFTDIDDTLTTRGKIPPQSYSALWKLFEEGIKVIPVTGRPAGWCDHIARMWPVEAIIGENGAFYYSYDRRKRAMKRRYLFSKTQAEERNHKLEKIKNRVLQEIPGSMVAEDQDFRIADLAIDYREDVNPLSPQQVEKICRIMEEEGAQYKVSSIHVNCWFGEYNKVECLKVFLKEYTGMELPELQDKVLFIGDSPNDEPMFKELKNTVAVANIKEFLPNLKFHPKYLTDLPTSEGFCETIDTVLQKRTKK